MHRLSAGINPMEEGVISLRSAGDISIPREGSCSRGTPRRGLILPQAGYPPTIIPLTHPRDRGESGDYASSDLHSLTSRLSTLSMDTNRGNCIFDSPDDPQLPSPSSYQHQHQHIYATHYAPASLYNASASAATELQHLQQIQQQLQHQLQQQQQHSGFRMGSFGVGGRCVMGGSGVKVGVYSRSEDGMSRSASSEYGEEEEEDFGRSGVDGQQIATVHVLLLSQAFPSLPYNSDTEMSTANKKPRRILKALRLIKKSSPIAKDSEGSIASKGGIKGPNASKMDRETSHVPNVAFRAIQQNLCNTRYRKASVRQSDILFLENEILCGVGTKIAVPKKKIVQSPQHISGILKLNASKERTLQKRKILNSTDNLPKKRRTLDVDKEQSLAPFKTLERNDNKPPFKPKAVPNFAQIFKVRSENTENIVEYKQRKAERAANLLSGAKSTLNAPKSTPTCVATLKMKRELTFTTENSPNIAKLPKLRYANQLRKSNRVLKVPQIRGKMVHFNENYITKLVASKHTPLTYSTPYIGIIVPSTNTQSTSSGHIIKKEIINKFGFRQDKKPNCLNLAQIPAISKQSPILKVCVESCGKAEKLFASKANRVKKDDMVKAVLTKLHPDREMATSRRHEIKGVRLNRRFELLMQMRSHTMP